jgi:cellulose biosynthesis protein BcsQ
MVFNFKAKTIAAYSIHSKTGKTTVAKELAQCYQMLGKKTLLVDCTFGQNDLFSMIGKSLHVPNLYDWVVEIDKKLKSIHWFDITYEPEEVNKYIAVHPGGMGLLTCQKADFPGKLAQIVKVILAALAKMPYDVIIFDARAEIREYIVRLLSAVDTVLLITDTYRYDVYETKYIMERLQEAGCRTDHFMILFNKKPSFFDDSPPQIAADLNLKMAGTLPDYPESAANFPDQVHEYNEAMKKVAENIW